jgi:hypothetical protein
MGDPLARPGLVAGAGAAAAFGLVLAVHAAGAVANASTTVVLTSGGSFALTVGIGLFVTLVAMRGD